MDASGTVLPIVSVCMPAHRDGPWFREALQSVLAQSYRCFEVVVSDNSGGNLRAAIALADDARIRYVSNPSPLGMSGNHARAIGAARGQIITFLHDDDRWEPTYLEEVMGVLDAYPDIGLVLTGAIDVDEDGAPMGIRPANMPAGRVDDPLGAFLRRDQMLMLPSLTAVRIAALSQHQLPWPDVIAGDVTLPVDVARAGWEVYHLDRPLVRYRVHTGQLGMALAQRDALVQVWSGYSFDGAHERLRRRRVGEALVARAGAHLREGDGRKARKDLRAAFGQSRRAASLRWVALGLASLAPSYAPRWHRGWARLRDPVAHRHRG